MVDDYRPRPLIWDIFTPDCYTCYACHMIDDDAERLEQLRRDRLAEAEQGLQRLVHEGLLTPETYGEIWIELHAESARLIKTDRVREMHRMRRIDL